MALKKMTVFRALKNVRMTVLFEKEPPLSGSSQRSCTSMEPGKILRRGRASPEGNRHIICIESPVGGVGKCKQASFYLFDMADIEQALTEARCEFYKMRNIP